MQPCSTKQFYVYVLSFLYGFTQNTGIYFFIYFSFPSEFQ